jgi:hypothetical protein
MSSERKEPGEQGRRKRGIERERKEVEKEKEKE